MDFLKRWVARLPAKLSSELMGAAGFDLCGQDGALPNEKRQ